jgi:hypothetical protein
VSSERRWNLRIHLRASHLCIVVSSPGESETALSFSNCSIQSAIGVLVLHLEKIILSETGLSLLLDKHEENFGAIFKIWMTQYHVCPSSSVILTKKHTHIDVQYATNMEYFYSKTNEMHNIWILFWNNTLHVSDGFSVHHQESKTVHIPDSVRTVLDSWWWTQRSSETCVVPKSNKFDVLFILLVLL